MVAHGPLEPGVQVRILTPQYFDSAASRPRSVSRDARSMVAEAKYPERAQRVEGDTQLHGDASNDATHMEHIVYILECANGEFYVGVTNNLQRRWTYHEQGDGGWYTYTNRPAKLVYTESYPARLAAERREQQLKGWSHAKKQALIQGDIKMLKAYSMSQGAKSSCRR